MYLLYACYKIIFCVREQLTTDASLKFFGISICYTPLWELPGYPVQEQQLKNEANLKWDIRIFAYGLLWKDL